MGTHVLSKVKEGLASINLVASLNKAIKGIVSPTREAKTKAQPKPEINTLPLPGYKRKATFWKRMREGAYLYPEATGRKKIVFYPESDS